MTTNTIIARYALLHALTRRIDNHTAASLDRAITHGLAALARPCDAPAESSSVTTSDSACCGALAQAGAPSSNDGEVG